MSTGGNTPYPPPYSALPLPGEFQVYSPYPMNNLPAPPPYHAVSYDGGGYGQPLPPPVPPRPVAYSTFDGNGNATTTFLDAFSGATSATSAPHCFTSPSPDQIGGYVPSAPSFGFIEPANVDQYRYGAQSVISSKEQWQDTPLPGGLHERWKCSRTHVYLLQHDGYVVAPNCERNLIIYVNSEFDHTSCSLRQGSMGNHTNSLRSSSIPTNPVGRYSPAGSNMQQRCSVLVESPRVCRVKLSPAWGHVFLTAQHDFIAFYDQCTSPSRSVVVSLPKDLDPKQIERLVALFESNASITTEIGGGALSTVTSTVESAFNYSTKFGSDVLKEKAPEFFKSTKAIRKGTGAVVRLAGSLMSKGATLVSETVAPSPIRDLSSQHDPYVQQLKLAVSSVKEQLSNRSVTYVSLQGPE